MGNEQSAPAGPLLVDADFLFGSATTLEFVHGGDGGDGDDGNNKNGNADQDAESTSMSYSDSSLAYDEGEAIHSGDVHSSCLSPPFDPPPMRTPPKSAPPQTASHRRRMSKSRLDGPFSPGQRLVSFLNRLDSRDFDAAAHRFFMSGLADGPDASTDTSWAANDDGAPRSPPRPFSVAAGFDTYYGEEDRYVGGGNGHGFFRDEESNEDGSCSSSSEAGNDGILRQPLDNGWVFGIGRKKRQRQRQRHNGMDAARTGEKRPGLPFSACTLGNHGSVDEDETSTKARSFDDSTVPDDLLACYAPTFIMKVTQSTSDLDRDYYIEPNASAPSLFQGFLGQRSVKSDPNLLSTFIDADAELTLMPDGDEPTFESDLRRKRTYHVITTAALPWMTGTAVNPLLRAVYLNRAAREKEKVAFNMQQAQQMEAQVDSTTRHEKSENKDDATSAIEEDGPEETDNISIPSTKTESDSTQFKPSSGVATLVIPWLTSEKDRKKLYGDDRFFNTKEEQERYIRDWVREMAGMPEEAAEQEDGGIGIVFYNAAYYPKFGSIFATDNICSLIRDLHTNTDVAILEEPEHLNWFNPCNWTEIFVHVIGVIHTNYKSYAYAQPFGTISSNFLQTLSTFVVRAHCNKVINLSGTLPSVAPYKETTCNVHGIRSDFFIESQPIMPSDPHCDIYFIGKLLWEKGFDKLLDLQSLYKKQTGSFFEMDIYGSGPDEAEIKRAFHGRPKKFKQTSQSVTSSVVLSDESGDDEDNVMAQEETVGSTPNKAKIASIIEELPKSRYELRRHAIPARFCGRKDHARLKGAYKIFVNCSISEVLCTTTAESIAMRNWVIIPFHPSNDFFARFPSALMYRSKSEFVEMLQFALHNDPPLLSDALSRELTWTAATERLIQAATVTKRQARRNEHLGYTTTDNRSALFHTNFSEKKEGIAFRNMFLREEEEEADNGRRTEGASPSKNSFRITESTNHS